jgi:hypothetical protein
MSADRQAEIEELRALAQRMLERLERLQVQDVDAQPKPREPSPEAYADVMARRRRRGR